MPALRHPIVYALTLIVFLVLAAAAILLSIAHRPQPTVPEPPRLPSPRMPLSAQLAIAQTQLPTRVNGTFDAMLACHPRSRATLLIFIQPRQMRCDTSALQSHLAVWWRRLNFENAAQPNIAHWHMHELLLPDGFPAAHDTQQPVLVACIIPHEPLQPIRIITRQADGRMMYAPAHDAARAHPLPEPFAVALRGCAEALIAATELTYRGAPLHEQLHALQRHFVERLSPPVRAFYDNMLRRLRDGMPAIGLTTGDPSMDLAIRHMLVMLYTVCALYFIEDIA